MRTSPFFKSAIEENPEVQGGTPVIRGTRLPVYQLIEYINNGYTFEEYGEIFDVDPELARRAFDESSEATRAEERQPA